MTFTNLLYQCGQAMSVVVVCGSIVSAVMPPPLDAGQADAATPGIMTTLRRSTAWAYAYRFFNACALNAGWARNLADPKSRLVIQQFFSLVTAMISKNAQAEASGGAASLVAPEIDVKALTPEVTYSGDLVVTQKTISAVSAVASGIATAVTQAAANK